MRIVLDTNVLIAAYATRGHCYELLEHCAREHILVSSPVLLAELREKLTRKVKFSSETADELLSLLHPVSNSLIRLRCALPPAATRTTIGCSRRKSRATAGVFITGDKDLLVLHPFRSVAIVSPADFKRFESLIRG